MYCKHRLPVSLRTLEWLLQSFRMIGKENSHTHTLMINNVKNLPLTTWLWVGCTITFFCSLYCIQRISSTLILNRILVEIFGNYILSRYLIMPHITNTWLNCKSCWWWEEQANNWRENCVFLVYLVMEDIWRSSLTVTFVKVLPQNQFYSHHHNAGQFWSGGCINHCRIVYFLITDEWFLFILVS